MKKRLSDLFKIRLVSNLVKVFLVIALIFAFLTILKFRSLPPELPLFYSLPRGKEQLGSPTSLLILPLISLVIFAANTLLGLVWYTYDRFMVILLLIIANIVSMLLLITFVKIIFLIT